MVEPKKEPVPQMEKSEAMREILILTNGDDIKLEKFQTTPLEMCEICRRILKMMKASV